MSSTPPTIDYQSPDVRSPRSLPWWMIVSAAFLGIPLMVVIAGAVYMTTDAPVVSVFAFLIVAAIGTLEWEALRNREEAAASILAVVMFILMIPFAAILLAIMLSSKSDFFDMLVTAAIVGILATVCTTHMVFATQLNRRERS